MHLPPDLFGAWRHAAWHLNLARPRGHGGGLYELRNRSIDTYE